MTQAVLDITPEMIVLPEPRRGRLPQLSEEEARTLTTSIQHMGVKLWLLVEQAHDRGAWAALGYSTWREYVSEELEMSESRSYQILDQAKVIRAMAAAGADPNEIDPPPARLVARLKDHLPEVKKATKKAIRAEVPVEDALRELAKSFRPARNVSLQIPAQRTASDAAPAARSTATEAEEGHGGDHGGEPPKPPRGSVQCPACDGSGHVARQLAAALKPAVAVLRQ